MSEINELHDFILCEIERLSYDLDNKHKDGTFNIEVVGIIENKLDVYLDLKRRFIDGD